MTMSKMTIAELGRQLAALEIREAQLSEMTSTGATTSGRLSSRKRGDAVRARILEYRRLLAIAKGEGTTRKA